MTKVKWVQITSVPSVKCRCEYILGNTLTDGTQGWKICLFWNCHVRAQNQQTDTFGNTELPISKYLIWLNLFSEWWWEDLRDLGLSPNWDIVRSPSQGWRRTEGVIIDTRGYCQCFEKMWHRYTRVYDGCVVSPYVTHVTTDVTHKGLVEQT